MEEFKFGVVGLCHQSTVTCGDLDLKKFNTVLCLVISKVPSCELRK